MKADAILRIRLLATMEGGRELPIIGKKYGCPIVAGENGMDCRFVYDQGVKLQLGETHEIPVKFLDRDWALQFLSAGVEISLWEGKTIGTGEVLEILA